MLTKCDFYDSNCKGKPGEMTHDGTSHKVHFMSQYARSWAFKVLNFNKESRGIIFIDCMSNAGMYMNKKNDFSKGTSAEVLSIFIKLAERANFKNKNFYVYTNDLNKDAETCQVCIQEKIRKGKSNVFAKHTSKDVFDFLNSDGLEILSFAKKNEMYVCLFYDPYKVMFDWNKLKPYLDYGKCDLIITHFWAQDSKRGLNQVTTNEGKKRYSEAYGLDFEELSSKLNSCGSGIDKNVLLRNLFVEKIKGTLSRNKFIGYAPVFNNNRSVLYDIVVISSSKKSRILLKDNMSKEYCAEAQKQLGEQLSLFPDIKSGKYEDDRKSGLHEMDFYYSLKNFCAIIVNNYKGKKVSLDEFNLFLDDHEFIPTNLKNEIRQYLKVHYNVNRSNDNAGQKSINFEEVVC